MKLVRTFTLLAATLSLPSVALADFDSAEGDRVVLSLGGGFGGEYEYELDTGFGSSNIDDDLEASLVLGARYELSLAKFFLLGFGLGYTRYEAEHDGDRNQFLDFTLVPTFAGAIRTRALTLEPRFGLAIGPSLNIFNEDDEDSLDAMGLNRTWGGWHLGFLPGLGLNFGDFGLLLEMGYMHHRAYADDDNGNDYQISTGQFILQAGFTVYL